MTAEPAAGAAGSRHDVVLFDGECNLCNGTVQFLLRRDRQDRFRFAALQSAAGRRLLGTVWTVEPLPDSVVLVAAGRVFLRSDAVLQIARRLPRPWSWAFALRWIPRPVRDLVYRWIARSRYRLFGRRQQCLVPTAALRARFLDDGQ